MLSTVLKTPTKSLSCLSNWVKLSIVIIVYTKEIHGIFYHRYATFSRQNVKNKFDYR